MQIYGAALSARSVPREIKLCCCFQLLQGKEGWWVSPALPWGQPLAPGAAASILSASALLKVSLRRKSFLSSFAAFPLEGGTQLEELALVHACWLGLW